MTTTSNTETAAAEAAKIIATKAKDQPKPKAPAKKPAAKVTKTEAKAKAPAKKKVAKAIEMVSDIFASTAFALQGQSAPAKELAEFVKSHKLGQHNFAGSRTTAPKGQVKLASNTLKGLVELPFVQSVTVNHHGNNARVMFAGGKVSANVRTTKKGCSVDLSPRADKAALHKVFAAVCTEGPKVKKGCTPPAGQPKPVTLEKAQSFFNIDQLAFAKIHYRNDKPTPEKSWHMEVNSVKDANAIANVLKALDAAAA